MDNIVVITIIAVFWLSGLLMTWSMCIVATRADRRMEERGRGCRPDDTSHGEQRGRITAGFSIMMLDE